MSDKDELLRQVAEEFAAFKASYAGLTDAHLTQVMLGTWSVREVLCHVAGWQREVVPVLERIARGEKPVPEGISYSDAEPWNAEFVKAYAGKSAAEMLREMEASYDALIAAARNVPEERFAPGSPAARTMEGVGPRHWKEHGEQIGQWRKAKGL
ncbi:MAG TPA: maleylpyruvate isomerase N-terminal domain-containing protein [Vicinamibacteria bacterium]|nr:maleylpyruvate isomerase N-terminal domain-containing protein [Vicinamibacteria bacterium]